MGKAIGLTFAILSGIRIGKEGPFVMIAAAVVEQLMSLPMFKHIRAQDTKRLEIIGCACACGVTACFGTPFGATLFSIEFTSSAYLVKSLPKAFLTSVTVMVIFVLFGSLDRFTLVNGKHCYLIVKPISCITSYLRYI
jgi:chloride channel 2